MDDVKLEWMRGVIYRFLSIEINDNAFEELLNRDNNLDVLKNLMDGSDEAQKCIFIFKETVEEEIEREEPEIEEKPEESSKVETSQSSQSVKSDSDEIVDIAEDEDKDDTNGNEFRDEDESLTDDENEERKSKINEEKEVEKKSSTSLLLIVKKIRLNLLLNITDHVPSRSYVYFLLIKPGPIPEIQNIEKSVEIMQGFFDVGCLNQHPVVCLDKLLTKLYMPMFGDEASISNHLCTDYPVTNEQLCLLFGDMNKEMKDFTDSTKHIIAQIEKSFVFTLLDIPLESSTEELAQEGEFVSDAEEILKEWSSVVIDLYTDVSKQCPPTTGILQEIHFWKEQMLKLSICCDQLSHRSIQKTVDILKMAGSDLTEFQTIVRNLEEELIKVTSNVNYLILMERNVKTLKKGGTYEDSIKALQQIFMVLKIIWVQSDYYKDVSNMSRLLQGISVLLKERVKRENEVEVLFRKQLKEVRQTIKESIDILSYWKELYLTECETVKTYGGSFWWGFDIRLFFDETDYIISICKDLDKISEALQQLHNIFNTNLRFYVEDIKDLDILENRIFGMTALVQYAEFDNFNPKFKTGWDRIMFVFFRDVKCYEEEMKTFIGKMFQKNLRWEDAYIFSKSFDRFAVSPAIKKFIGKCQIDMLKQYTREIVETENLFLEQEREPPMYEGIPPCTSAILWVRDLRHRISSPMAQIRDGMDLAGRDKEVHKRFEKAEELLKRYEIEKFEVWKPTASERLNKFLQSYILKKIKITSFETTATKQIRESLSYQVNFPTQMEEVSTEAKLLEEMGYEIPTFVKTVVLQEATFNKFRNKLKSILEDLKTSLSELTIEEVSTMGIPIENLNSVLDLGITQMQWESTDIPGFLKKSQQAVDIFRGLVTQIKSIVTEIDRGILSLVDCDLFEFTKTKKDTIPTCEEFFGHALMKLEDKAETMIKIYLSLEPLLIKLEKLTCNKSTGKSEQMRKYYTYCEERVLTSLVKMMVANLEYFRDEVFENFIFPYTKAAFKCPDELITSSMLRIKLIFLTFMKRAIECTRKLIRWLDGSCIESSSFYVEETKCYVEFSYYLDLSMHPKVKTLMLSIINTFFDYVDSLSNK